MTPSTVDSSCNRSIGSSEQTIAFAWLFLALAIMSEVIGLTVMKVAVNNGHVEGYVFLYALIALSYYFLSKAVRTIPVGVAYAIWEGSGIALITLVSAFVFHHVLTAREMIGLAMAVSGILMVSAGAHHEPALNSQSQNREGSPDGIT